MVLYMDHKIIEINGILIITLTKKLCDLHKMKAAYYMNIEQIGNEN